MLRALVLLLAAVSGGCSTVPASNGGNSAPIRVAATGPTLQIARERAFRNAIESKVGVAVLNEYEAKNDQLVRNDTLHYSSGYVERYTIVSEQSGVNTTTVVYDVWVSDSKIATRILHNGTQQNLQKFDGKKIAAQVDTLAGQKDDGEKLFGQVLATFSRDAVIMEQYRPYRFVWDTASESGEILVPVKLRWNHNYLRALRDSLKRSHIHNPYGSRDYNFSVDFGFFARDNASFSGVELSTFASLWTSVTEPQSVGNLWPRTLGIKSSPEWRPQSTLSLISADGTVIISSCFTPPLQHDMWRVTNTSGTNWLTFDAKEESYIDFRIPVVKGDAVHRSIRNVTQLKFSRGCIKKSA